MTQPMIQKKNKILLYNGSFASHDDDWSGLFIELKGETHLLPASAVNFQNHPKKKVFPDHPTDFHIAHFLET